jgi:carbamoyltransferase
MSERDVYILGLSFDYHDAAAALIKNGRVVAAAQEERFTREKHDSALPVQAITYCLEFAGIKAEDLTHVVFYEKPFIKFERLLKT